MEKLGDWVGRSFIDSRLFSQERLAQAAGVSKGTIGNGINDNKWSRESVRKLGDFLHRMKLIDPSLDLARDFEITWLGDGHGSKAKALLILDTFAAALKDLEGAEPEAREDALHAVFAAITPEDNAFLVITTYGRRPSPFELSPRYDRMRESLYSAHARGLMTLFVTPEEGFLSRAINALGPHEIPSVANFRRGFDHYRKGFLDWCREKREKQIEEPEALAERQFAHVEVDLFLVTSWRYIACYAGINPSNAYGQIIARIIERGPINRHKITVAPPDMENELGMRNYIQWVLSTTNTNPQFREELASRMEIRTNDPIL